MTIFDICDKINNMQNRYRVYSFIDFGEEKELIDLYVYDKLCEVQYKLVSGKKYENFTEDYVDALDKFICEEILKI